VGSRLITVWYQCDSVIGTRGPLNIQAKACSLYPKGAAGGNYTKCGLRTTVFCVQIKIVILGHFPDNIWFFDFIFFFWNWFPISQSIHSYSYLNRRFTRDQWTAVYVARENFLPFSKGLWVLSGVLRYRTTDAKLSVLNREHSSWYLSLAGKVIYLLLAWIHCQGFELPWKVTGRKGGVYVL